MMLRFIIAVLMTGTIISACADVPDDLISGQNESALYGAGTASTLWNGNQLGVSALIPICFATRPQLVPPGNTINCPNQINDNVDCKGNVFNPSVSTLRETVRGTIENTWQRAANIEFTGWGACPLTNNQINLGSLTGNAVVVLGDADSSDVGKQSNRATVINLNWVNFVKNTQGNLIHEFGHALGFLHENERPGYVRPPDCGDNIEPPVKGGVNLTPFIDFDSAMDKCEPFNPLPVLSSGDLMGVQRAYGRKGDHSIVGFRGQCVNVLGGGSAINLPVGAYPCRNSSNDTWRVNSTRFSTSIGGQQRCLNVQGGVVSNSSATPIVSWSCDNGSNEIFATDEMEWHAMGNMCITMDGQSSVSVEPCRETIFQLWSFIFSAAGDTVRIKSASSGKCATILSGTGSKGEEVSMVACSDNDTRQIFQLPGKGIMAHGSLCLNVFGGLPMPGSRLGLWNGCTDTPRGFNEQFTASGPLKSLGQCLDIIGGVAHPGDPIGVFPCDFFKANQTWEYYF